MAISYDQRKQQYESFDDNQKQKRWDMVNNSKEWSTMKQYMNQYNNEMNNNQQQTSNESNFNNQNGTNWQNQTQQQPIQQTANGDTRQNPNWVEKTITQEEMQNSINEAQANMKNQNNVSPELDQSKFNEAPWKITVQEWTWKETGKPDYQISTDARLNEMKGNLDQYFATSPRMFSDRDTFNRVFDYNNRESDAQRQLLDSYWKRKEDMDKASTYTSWESINTWMKNWEITTDQLNLLKEYNPEAYRKWQQLQEDEILKRIVNDIVPPAIEAISWKINSMIEALGIQAQDALDIEWIYNDTMTKVGAYQTLEDCNRTVKEIEAITNKKTAIMNRYAASTWGTVSDALAAARMQKAIAPYNEQLQGLQYQYQDYSNLYSQKSATALQAANVRALQANENQRIWNQKCQALGFAMDAMSYRTPEQQAQLRLQELQAQNDMQLLQQSRLNDLNRYNQYATAKLNNQLQQELTDLSVEDENQLKANLNNALSDYYKNYGDIIQRSQAQAVEDIIKYAKDHNMSVAQALTESFIKPLQNKAEYKQKVASDYEMLSKQSIGTINWRSVIMTTNPNWSISYQYIDDNWAAIESTYKVWDTEYVKLYNGETMTAEEYNKRYWGDIKAYNQVDSRAFTADPISTWYEWKTLYDFLNDPKNQAWNTWWQCAAFVNRYLESIWVGKYYGLEDVKTREKRCNSDTPQVWTIAVFDYNHYTDWKNYGHVAIVTKTYADWSFDVIDSNYDTKNPWKITKRHINAGTSSLKWFFDPSQPPSATSTGSSLWSIDEAKKQNYLEEARRWQMTDTNVAKIWDIAAEQGWSEEWREALKQGKKWTLTDAQIKLMDKTDSQFSSSPIVKEFESAINQIEQLQVALNDASWVWDMSAIFTFMKTLDPSSVVRESEFNSAAATAWVVNPSAIWQNLERSYDWKFLTPQQRTDFKEIAKEFIKIKAKNYQTKYNDLLKRYDYYWLDTELAPTNMADVIIESISGWATWPTTDKEKYFEWYYTPANISTQDYENASFILG